jgi:signal transduction histidine kinase
VRRDINLSQAENIVAKSAHALSRAPTDWFSRDLIEILPAAVYVCNSEAVVVAYNRRAVELWGREPTPGDTDQKYCGAHRLYLTDGTFMPHRDTPMEWVLRTGEPARDMEVIIERPDSSRITVLVNIAPLFGEDGKLVGAVNCFQDLTAQKAAERERIRLAEELHQAKKLEALGQLTAGVAHDFNNLLTSMLGNLDLIGDRIGDKDALRLLDNAVRSAQRASALNEQLLAFARKQALLPKAIDINQVLARMRGLLQTTIGDTIRLDMRPRQDVWPALVDLNQIELVILNLAINARDAMPLGGALIIETRNATVGAMDRQKDLSAGDYVVLSISDTGTGMNEEVRAKAFEPFFTTKEPGKGSGLGLSMALGVARQSGGSVLISSRPNEGASVEIYLPRANSEASRVEDGESPVVSAPMTRGQVILVVDDDPDVREVTVAMLSSSGYRVIEAGSGPAALEVLGSRAHVDLMIADIAMPDINGIETARRARHLRPDLPVLLSSGYVDVAQFVGSEIDRDHIIGKPYRPGRFAQKNLYALGAPLGRHVGEGASGLSQAQRLSNSQI